MYTKIDAQLVENYLTTLKEKSGLTLETIAKTSGSSESTIKKLFTGKTDNPGIDTLAPIIYAMGGSIDEMYNPGKNKDEVKEISINSIKEMYEFQLAEQRKTEEAHISNIRVHYEQHRNDTITNYERLLSEKENQVKLFKRITAVSFAIACVGFAILIGLLILEVSNPNLGWIQF